MVESNKLVPEGYKQLKEGQANILYIEEKLHVDEDNMIKTNKGKRMASDINETRGAVFYNPVQEFNRDISILSIREFEKILKEERTAKGKPHEGVSVLEALAATGLRSVRYMKEIDNITNLCANDFDPAATELMQKNFDHNDLDKSKYEIHTKDANYLMQTMKSENKYFDVIDLDPYGTAIPFLESTLSNMTNGGLLCVTFTDMAVLCARKPHVCFYKYGASPLGKSYCHEMALRIVLYMINTMANKYQKQIEPLMSLTVDFYVRLFIRVKHSASECHKSLSRYSHVYQCVGCESFYLQRMGLHIKEEVSQMSKKKKRQRKQQSKQNQTDNKQKDATEQDEEVKDQQEPRINERIVHGKMEVPTKCKVCDNSLQLGGPIWNKPIHNYDFVKRLMKSIEHSMVPDAKRADLGVSPREVNLKTAERIKGVLGGIIDEQPMLDLPLSYDVSMVASDFKTCLPTKRQMLNAFHSLGYKAIQTYYDSNLWKTDAPNEVVYDIFKAWKVSLGGDIFKNVPSQGPSRTILSKEVVHKPDFEYKEPEVDGQKKEKQLRKYFTPKEANWGPKARATGKRQKTEDEKNDQ